MSFITLEIKRSSVPGSAETVNMKVTPETLQLTCALHINYKDCTKSTFNFILKVFPERNYHV